jgi:ABC-type phosphate/phosphonate transport system substrate-binding protein
MLENSAANPGSAGQAQGPLRHPWRISRVSTSTAFAVLIIVASSFARGGGQSGSPDTSIVRFGMTQGVLEPDVNPNDALAAVKIWASTLGNSSGKWNKTDARIFADATSLVAAVDRGEMDVVTLSTQEYLGVEGVLKAEPALTIVQAGQVEIEYVVLVRSDSDLKWISDLRDKRLIVPRGGRSTMVTLWLEAFLYDNGLPPRESFFRETREVAKNSQVILPVFFKQADAGVVTKSAFETAVTLNPQLRQQLRVIATSPRLIPAVVCVRTTLAPDWRAAYLNQALTLHETPNGLQTFTVFKLDRMVRWEPRYFDAVRELVRKQKRARRPAITTLQ